MHPRSDVFGAALPCNADGSLRPLLAPCRYLTVHWVGAGVWGDPGDTPDEMRAIQSYATGANKGWEYNYVVDSEGECWEYAGAYQAAHSAGENAIAIGVLLLAGPGDEITDAMVLGVRRLRWELEQRGALRAGYEIRPHQQMPGAATACPGPAMARWSEIAAPWSPPVDPPTPPPIEETDMLAIYRPTFSSPGYDPAWFAIFASGIVRRATNPDVALAARLNVPTLDLDSEDQYNDLLHVSESIYPARS